MAIYRKGEDQSGLQKAAEEQATSRKFASAEDRGKAGLGGGGQPYVSNLHVDTSSGTPKAFTKKYKGFGDKNPTNHYVTNVPISASQVGASRERKRKKDEKSGRALPVEQKSTRTTVGGGVIEKGKLIKASWKGEHYTKQAPKKKAKAAGMKDTRAALKGGHITIDEAASLNKKLMTPSVKKKK